MDIIGNDVFSAKQCVGIVLFWTHSQFLPTPFAVPESTDKASEWRMYYCMVSGVCTCKNIIKLFYSPHSAGVTATTTTKEN